MFGPAHGLTPPLRVGIRDEGRRGPASRRCDGRPPSDRDRTAPESVPMMAPECPVRGWSEASRDCNEQPILEEVGEDAVHCMESPNRGTPAESCRSAVRNKRSLEARSRRPARRVRDCGRMCSTSDQIGRTSATVCGWPLAAPRRISARSDRAAAVSRRSTSARRPERSRGVGSRYCDEGPMRIITSVPSKVVG